jgi:hypothetical protein
VLQPCTLWQLLWSAQLTPVRLLKSFLDHYPSNGDEISKLGFSLTVALYFTSIYMNEYIGILSIAEKADEFPRDGFSVYNKEHREIHLTLIKIHTNLENEYFAISLSQIGRVRIVPKVSQFMFH